jgi:hypothetical protein
VEDKQSNIEISKSPESTSNQSREKLLTILNSAAKKIEKLLQEHEIQPEEAILEINKYYLDIESVRPQWGSFSFWGGLVENSSFPEFRTREQYIPIIKNLRLPDKIRSRGLGSAIVKTWEKSMEESGFKDFAITNLSGPKAVSFWQGHGYKIPVTEKHKKIPYYMSKKLN